MNIINMIINAITGGIKMLAIFVGAIIALIFLFDLANKDDGASKLFLASLILLFVVQVIIGACRKK